MPLFEGVKTETFRTHRLGPSRGVFYRAHR